MVKKSGMFPKRGDIFLVNFDPTVGAEIRKTRPAIVLQNNIANKYSSVTIVAAITSYAQGQKVYPTEVYIPAEQGGLKNDSMVLLNQVRTIDKVRLLTKLGSADRSFMKEVTAALEISFGILDV